MNIDHIKAFVEVTATGSFQHAADQLNVTQSTISARIKALEERLNRQLFHRKRNGVALTTGGHQFYPNAVNIVRAWERGQQMASLPEGLSGLVSLGVDDNHWPRVVQKWLTLMEEALPNVAASVVSDRSDVLMEKVRSGVLDMAVLYDPQHCAEASIEQLNTEELVLVSTRPRSVESGPVRGYVFVDWGETFRAQHSMHFPGVFSHKLTSRNSHIALQHILANGGSGYFLASAVESLVEEGRLHLVHNAPTFQRAVFVAARSDVVAPEVINVALNVLRSSIN